MSAPRYRIARLADFLLVPADRLPACLLEFADWCEVMRQTDALLRTLAPDHPADQPIVAGEVFDWCDDGAHHVTMNLIGEDGTPLVRAHFPEEGPVEVTINQPSPKAAP